MQHHFDISIATLYGVNVAIFLDNMAFWIQKNMANDKNFRDGFYWTYNTQKALIDLFPYWTRQTLRTTLKKCVDEKLITIKKFNKNNHDQTSWYTLSEVGLSLFPTLLAYKNSICENQPIQKLKTTNPEIENHQCIKETDRKPDRKQDRGTKIVPAPIFLPDDFKISDENLELCKKYNLNLEIEFKKFKIYYQRKRKSDWNKYFMLWLLRSSGWNKNEIQNSNNLKNDHKKVEIKSTVQEYGPGHPTWEMNNKWKDSHISLNKGTE